VRDVIGPYKIVRPLGEGGMGIVYEATDERLGRRVALKTIRPQSGSPDAKDRLWREARLGASVNHPNVCQVHDVGEVDGELYVAMELLEGEPLAARIARGPMPPAEALSVALGMLAALEALHAKGVLHRDLKPSNVFLTPHGVKLLDFGLSLPAGPEARDGRRLTMTGTIVGTPEYMAPERWTDEDVGPASDLFSLGAILFEMVTGRMAFQGRSPMEVYHAVAHEQPPALSGGAGADALDRLVQRALAKAPKDRYASAAEMAQAVREAMQAAGGSAATPTVRTITRLIALPFRLLKADPDVEFLAVGLPDAVSTSLSSLQSIVVRSPHAGAKFAGSNPDLRALAAEAAVDVVLVGTLLRAGDRVRVTAQLLEAPGGTILWSETAQVPMGDLFALQDDLARRIVDSLALPLSARDRAAGRPAAPASPRAYELFLRANHVASVTEMLPRARDIYLEALREDPRYAPAWARLGRCYRVMGKYAVGDDPAGDLVRAKEAFEKAFELDPDLPLAHNLYTHFEVEELGRAREAMVRLLGRAQARPADPDLFAGLVLVCRFGGLLDASIAADRRARRLDPGVRTSVSYTYFMAGDYENAMEHEDQDMRWLHLYSLPLLGREEEAKKECRLIRASHPGGYRGWMVAAMEAALERRRADCLEALRQVRGSSFHDPEGLYFTARAHARIGETGEALASFRRVVDGGFHCPAAFLRDSWLDPLRAIPEFGDLVRRAEEGHRASVEAFRAAGGDRLLGVAV
jgi:eukaryotic-like serine/threonine-protein kinase